MWGYFEIIWNILGVVFFLGGMYLVRWCIQDAYKEYALTSIQVITDQQEAKTEKQAEKLKRFKAIRNNFKEKKMLIHQKVTIADKSGMGNRVRKDVGCGG